LSWDLHPAGPYGLGEHDVCVTVSDGHAQDSCMSRVTVRDCEPPALVCPAPLIAECTGRNSAYVVPGAATAVDACSQAQVSGPVPDFYALGSNVVRYTARDASGNESSCTSTIEVVDQTPPVVTLTPPAPLWPADQTYRTVRLEDCIVVHDRCGGGLTQTGASAAITCVSSDEPQSGAEPDVVFVDATTVKVRADRLAHGDGRVYSLQFEVRDTAGNLTPGICPVGVPLARDGAPVKDSGEQWRVCRPDRDTLQRKPIPVAE
ncbi:MAG: HYR domain-containing protein, partial [Archangium sp.]